MLEVWWKQNFSCSTVCGCLIWNRESRLFCGYWFHLSHKRSWDVTHAVRPVMPPSCASILFWPLRYWDSPGLSESFPSILRSKCWKANVLCNFAMRNINFLELTEVLRPSLAKSGELECILAWKDQALGGCSFYTQAWHPYLSPIHLLTAQSSLMVLLVYSTDFAVFLCLSPNFNRVLLVSKFRLSIFSKNSIC